MRKLLFDHALLPTGWARNVGLDIDCGVLSAVIPGTSREGREHVAGIAIPGLPNLHSHTFQRGMAGLAETRGPAEDSFWTWRQVMYRFLAQLGPDEVEALAAYAMMEMLEGGFTSVAEFHYLHHGPDGRPYADPAELAGRIAAASAETGLGLTLLPVFYSNGGFGGLPPAEAQRRFVNDVDGYLRLFERSRRSIAALADAAIGIAPHSLRAVTPSGLSAVLDAVREGPVHIHVAEQVRELQECLTWSGCRPVAWLLQNAPVDPRWCLVHATHLDARRSTASPRPELLRDCVRSLRPISATARSTATPSSRRVVALASDPTPTSRSRHRENSRQLEYSQRLVQRARNVLAGREGQSSGRTLYDGALAGGAQAVGRRVGKLAPGFRADIVVLDSDHPDLACVGGDRWLDAYLFVTGKNAVDLVIVAGEQLVAGGRHRARDAVARRFRNALCRLVS